METTLLTKENAHRVTMVRRVDAPESEPVAFLFRGKRHGIAAIPILSGIRAGKKSSPRRTSRTGRLWKWRIRAIWKNTSGGRATPITSPRSHPTERGGSDIASHEKELHEDLQFMPEQQQERYMENYKRYFSAMIAANSRCASAMITGPARFNTGRNEKACNSHNKSVTAFREWRERALEAIRKAPKPPSPKNSVSRRNGRRSRPLSTMPPRPFTVSIRVRHEAIAGLSSSATSPDDSPPMSTMAMSKSSTVPSLVCESGTARVKKPVVTARHSIFKYPELVRKVREKQQEQAGRENREIPFDGGKVVCNFEEDRLQILFDKIPDTDMRTDLEA